MGQKAATGGTNGKAPIGYLNVIRRDELGREMRTVGLDPARAPLVTWAFEAYATGNYSTITLREELIDRALTTAPTPRRPAKPPALSTIQRLLSSPYYKGDGDFCGATYEGLHEPLASPAGNRSRRAAITIAVVVVVAVAIVALLIWIGFNVFAGDVLQCYTPKDDHTPTLVCP